MAWIDAATHKGLIGYIVADERGVAARSAEETAALGEARKFRAAWGVRDAIADLVAASGEGADRAVVVFARSAEVGDKTLLHAAAKNLAHRRAKPVMYRLSRGQASEDEEGTDDERSEESESWRDVEYQSESDSDSTVMSGWSR